MGEHGMAEQVAAARGELGALSARATDLSAPTAGGSDRRGLAAELRADLDRLGERVEALRAARLRQLGGPATSRQQEIQAVDARDRLSPPASGSDLVSSCWDVDFEKTGIAEARRSGDVLAALSRLTERAREVGEVRRAYLAQQDQADDEDARAEQLARWHADDQAAEQTAAVERNDAIELPGGEAA